MKPANITKIEIWKSDFHSGYCALVYIDCEEKPVARVDDGKVKFASTLATRIAGVDYLMQNPTLENLMNHELAKIM